MKFASFTQDVERLIDDPFAVADRLKRLLAIDVLVPPAENIHSVTAVCQGKTISVHVYGADIDRLSLRCFDDVPQFLPGSDRQFPDA